MKEAGNSVCQVTITGVNRKCVSVHIESNCNSEKPQRKGKSEQQKQMQE